MFDIPMRDVTMTQDQARNKYEQMSQAVNTQNAEGVEALEVMRKQIASQVNSPVVSYKIPERDMEVLNHSLAGNLMQSNDLNLRNMDTEMQMVITNEGFYNNRYVSVEGGTDTIGIGHKMLPDEHAGNYVWINGRKQDLTNPLSDEQVIQLWEQDEIRARNQTIDTLKGYGMNANALTPDMFNVMKNLHYNMGTVPRSLVNNLAEGDMPAFNHNLLRMIGMKGNSVLSAGLARNRANNYNRINKGNPIVGFEFNLTEDGKTVYTYYNATNQPVQQYVTDKPLDESNSYDRRYDM